MSFLYDKNLLETFAKIAQVPQQVRQEETGRQQAMQNNYSIAIDLLNNLSNQVSSGQAPGEVNINAGTDNPASIKLNDLRSFNDLINFILTNKIMVQNIPIAIKKEDFGQVSPANKKYFTVKYPEPDDEVGENYQYVINPNALAYFIYSLSQNKNPILRAALSGMQNELQAIIKDPRSAIEAYKETSFIPEMFDEKYLIDRLPKNINIMKPLDRGTIELNLGNIKDAASFGQWMQQNNFSFTDVNDKNKVIEHSLADPNLPVNILNKYKCQLINILFARSNNMVQRADAIGSTNEQLVSYWKEYERRVSDLARASNCEVNVSKMQEDERSKAQYKEIGTNDQEQDKDDKDDKDDLPPGAPGRGTPADHSTLALTFPFRPDIIDLSSIQDFLNTYARSFSRADIGIVQNALRYLSAAQRYGISTIPIGQMTKDNFEDQLKSLSTQLGSSSDPTIVYKFLSTLYYLVNSVEAVLANYVSRYPKIPDNVREQLLTQMGATTNDASSFYFNNKSKLDDLLGWFRDKRSQERR